MTTTRLFNFSAGPAVLPLPVLQEAKDNLLALPVVDDEGKLAGVITADDIISVLRQR